MRCSMSLCCRSLGGTNGLHAAMHFNEYSGVDGTNKVSAIVVLGTCPETDGARIYYLYKHHELLYSDDILFDDITGRM